LEWIGPEVGWISRYRGTADPPLLADECRQKKGTPHRKQYRITFATTTLFI
jgi:hypothetical protein